VKIGGNLIAISYARKAHKSTYILQQKKNWMVYFSPQTGTFKRWVLDGELVKPTLIDGRPGLRLKGWKHHLVLLN
jgi:hypothetical protein